MNGGTLPTDNDRIVEHMERLRDMFPQHGFLLCIGDPDGRVVWAWTNTQQGYMKHLIQFLVDNQDSTATLRRRDRQ